MAGRIDRRVDGVDRATPERLRELQQFASALSARLPGNPQLQVERVDPLTGNPAVISVRGAPAENDDVARSASTHVVRIGELLGFGGSAPSQFATTTTATASSGGQAVQLKQQHQRIDVFDAALTVRFTPQRELAEITGRSVTIRRASAAVPALAAQAAVQVAAEQLAASAATSIDEIDAFGQSVSTPQVDPAQLGLRVIAARSDQPDQPTQLADGPAIGTPITARLVWFSLHDELRLAWEVALTLAAENRSYRSVVDATDGTLLYWQPG